MSKLNVKVVDMEPPMIDQAKKVTHLSLTCRYRSSTRLSKTTARSASSLTASRKSSTKSQVSISFM